MKPSTADSLAHLLTELDLVPAVPLSQAVQEVGPGASPE